MARIQTYDVLGVPVSVTSLGHASHTIRLWTADDVGRFICVRDVHGIMQARRDERLMELHCEAAMVVPDGMPLVWIGKRQGLPVARTCGPDLIDRVIGDSAGSSISHYFYGGKPQVADQLSRIFESKYSDVCLVGSETPPFRDILDDELEDLARRLRESGADIVWIGLSTPKQEFLMQRLAPLVSATLIGVGAAFDFHTGAVRRAPQWMQRCGLEWSFRLIIEPRRLWRRYLVMAPQFLAALALGKRAK